MSKASPTNQRFDITFQVQLPHEWDPNLGNYNVGITAGVETDRCSREWATIHREKMDLVIVPSSHARSSFTASGTGDMKTPIKIVPEAYFSEILNEPTIDPLSDVSTSRNFLIIGTLTSDDPLADRKNLVASIKWFLEAFKKNDDVGLIVKTTQGRETTIDRELVRKMLKSIKQSVKNSSPPKVYMLHGSMTRQEMTNLYKSPKLCGLLSATRGEGFGLPLLEAAAVGLPIVATDWSAHTEFLSGNSFLRVKYRLSQIPDSRVDKSIFVSGARWAEVSEGNFKRKIKNCLRNNLDLREFAKTLSQKIKNTHSLKAIFECYECVLVDILEV
jgi:glycosyltransferase involved in cell wall biosynthesis